MTIKYITFKLDGFEQFITFSQFINHSYFEDIGTILGAGFVKIAIKGEINQHDELGDKAQYECFGKSDTLGIGSRGEEDSKILNRFAVI